MNHKNKINRNANTDSCIDPLILRWLAFCLIGAILYCILPLPSDTFNFQIPDTIIEYSFPYAFAQKDFWLFLISSTRYELCFFLLFTVLARMNHHVLFLGTVFGIRGLLFGFGGMGLLQKTEFLFFFLVVVRQVLFVALLLYFASFLCGDNGNRSPRQRVFFCEMLLYTLGMSLLIQFLFLFLLLKI